MRNFTTASKEAAPTYAQIMKLADARVAQTSGLTREQALVALVHEHPNESCFYEAYRRYHTRGDALRDHDARQIAKFREVKSS